MGDLETEHVEPRDLEPAAVIDFDEFEEDRRDPEWAELLEASAEHVETLDRTGRNR